MKFSVANPGARCTSLKGKESAKNYVYRLYVTGPGARIILICISNFSHALLLVTRVVLPFIGDRHRGIVDPAIPMAFAISPTTDEADHRGGSIRDAILIGQTRDIIVLLNS